MKAFARSIIVSSFLSIIAAFVCFGHAEAHSLRHHHRHAHYHHRIARHWHRHHWHRHVRRHWHGRYATRKLPAKAYRYEARVAAQSSDILATAERYLGDRNPTGFRGPWCKAYVNFIARETGHYFNRSKRAIDALYMGIRVHVPRPGDVAVMRHHVTFYAGRGGRGFIGLGGNQSGHRVTVSSYPVYRVIAWVRLQ